LAGFGLDGQNHTACGASGNGSVAWFSGNAVVGSVLALPRLTVRTILAWADAHRQRTGTWPTSNKEWKPGEERQGRLLFHTGQDDSP
jgi:hypothetical protein